MPCWLIRPFVPPPSSASRPDCWRMRSLRSSFFGRAPRQMRLPSNPGRRPGSPRSKCRTAFTFGTRCRRPRPIAWRRTACARNMAPTTPIDVNYRVDGPPTAPVLVLSHALGLSLAMWDPQVEPLSRAFRVVRYDHRGHGASPVPSGPYTIEAMGRDLVHLLDRLGLDRVSFCGLSLGGMVGMWVASNAPERVDRLVLCCTAARMPRPDDFAARARTVREQGMEAIADPLIGRWFTPSFPATHPGTVARIRAMLLSTPREGYA